jgi:hypothetical protein
VGLFGGSRKSISHEQTKLHALRVQTSALGQALVLQFGTARLWGSCYRTMTSLRSRTPQRNQLEARAAAAERPRPETTYTYTTASEIFLCVGKPKIAGMLSLVGHQGKPEDARAADLQ